MKRRKRNPGYFSKGNLIFWALILLWIGIQFLHLLDPLFDEARVTEKFRKLEAQERLESNLDSLRQIVRDSIEKKQPEPGCPVARYTWKWQDPFTGRNESMSFEICESEAQNAGNFRKNLRTADLREVYVRMSESDALPLNGMVQSFRATIKSRGMGYEKALFFIVGAIQAIPYTLVLQGGGPLRCPCTLGQVYYLADCRVRADRRGCCNDIEPAGLFSPLEFALHKKGDCDTRTLFAYTVLGSLGYDITILNSDAEGHSILGVHSPRALGNGDYIRGKNGRKYYIWELTAPSPPGVYTYNSSKDSWFSVMK